VTDNSTKGMENRAEAVTTKASSGYPTPFRTLGIITASIFIAETVVMYLLSHLAPINETAEMFLDSFLLVLLLSPILYFFLLNPILMNRTERILLEQRLSPTDALTGLYSRQGFFTLAEHQLKIANRLKQGFFLLYARMANIKEVNIMLGREEGDHALIDIGNVLKEYFRGYDIVARIDKITFVVMQFRNPEEGVENMTARLQEKLEMHNTSGKHKYKLALNTTVVYYDPDLPCSIEDLLTEASKKL